MGIGFQELPPIQFLVIGVESLAEVLLLLLEALMLGFFNHFSLFLDNLRDDATLLRVKVQFSLVVRVVSYVFLQQILLEIHFPLRHIPFCCCKNQVLWANRLHEPLQLPVV